MKKIIAKARELPYSKKIGYLILIATVVRLIVSGIMEFSIDEVYYWTYALYPDISHFDHPPMVGVIIQLFTFDLALESEFFIRLGAVVLSAINTFMIFKIGTKIKNEQTGFFAALLYTASIYSSVLSGIFILPDTPQLFFWVLCIWFYISAFESKEIDSKAKLMVILGGIACALAIMSKYHSVFIILGIKLYIIFFDKRWIKQPSMYISLLIAAAGLIPIIYWNFEYDFISFTFHGDRVTPALQLKPEYFFREIGGQVAYNNPINYFLILWSVVGFFKGKEFLDKRLVWFFLFSGVPLILLFTSFSLFRATLPHWSGPGYLPLLFIAAAHMSWRYEDKTESEEWVGTPRGLKASNYLVFTLMLIAIWLINYSPLQLGKTDSKQKFGEFDFTQDMYGWQQIADGFKEIQQTKNLPEQDFVAKRYFPGSHIHYYVVHPLNRNIFMTGSISEVHKYAWINMEEGGLQEGKSYYHIAVSNYYWDPIPHFEQFFEEVVPIDTIEVTRGGKTMRYGFLYDCKNYNGQYQNPLKKK